MNIIINLISIISILVLFIWSDKEIYFNASQKKIIETTYIFIILTILSEIACTFTDNQGVELRYFSIVSNVLGFSISPVIPMIIGLIYCKNVATYKKLYIVPVLNAIAVLVSPITGWIFYVSPDNTYYRGRFFIIYVFATIYAICCLSYVAIKKVKYYPPFFHNIVYVSEIFLMFGYIIQMFFPKYHVVWLTVSIYTFMQFIFICESHNMIDSLTEIMDREAFDRQLSWLKKSKQLSGTIICIADINNFKKANDENGHLYGDFCLKKMAEFLVESFSEHCQVFRYGGDEFIIICYKSDAQKINKCIKKCNAKIHNKKKQDADFPNISFGYSLYKSGIDLNDMIMNADRNMYKEKTKMQ